MTAFIDENRDVFGVGPICNVLPTAPSNAGRRCEASLRGTYYVRAAVTRNPDPASDRAKRNEALSQSLLVGCSSGLSFLNGSLATDTSSFTCRHSSVVEQSLRKRWVGGSNPSAGTSLLTFSNPVKCSTLSESDLKSADWRNSGPPTTPHPRPTAPSSVGSGWLGGAGWWVEFPIRHSDSVQFTGGVKGCSVFSKITDVLVGELDRLSRVALEPFSGLG